MDDLENFRKMVSGLASDLENRVFLNSSSIHAVIVLSEMFKISNNEIKIFAGCLTGEVGDNPEYIQALSDFIERTNGNIQILLNNVNSESCKNSNLIRRLAYYQTLNKNIIIKTTDKKPYLAADSKKMEVHFTIADRKSYRIEMDINERRAACNFNDPELCENFVTVFDSMFCEAKHFNLFEI